MQPTTRNDGTPLPTAHRRYHRIAEAVPHLTHAETVLLLTLARLAGSDPILSASHTTLAEASSLSEVTIWRCLHRLERPHPTNHQPYLQPISQNRPASEPITYAFPALDHEPA